MEDFGTGHKFLTKRTILLLSSSLLSSYKVPPNCRRMIRIRDSVPHSVQSG